MSNRAAKFMSALFASILAAGPLTTISLGAAGAADDCLSAPNAEAPDGSHWYYRIDRATKRHCWYVRETGEKLSQTRAPSSRSAKIDTQQTEPVSQRSIADAHAELPAQPRFQQPIRNDPPVLPDAAVQEANAAAAVPEQQAEPSVVGSRWPEPTAVTSRIDPPVADSFSSKLASISAPAPVPAVSAVPVAATRATPQDQSESMPMLLAAIAGALALAAVAVSIVLKLGAARRRRQPKLRRRVNWERTGDEAIAVSQQPGPNLHKRRSGVERDLRRAVDPNERIARSFSPRSSRAPS